MQLFDWTNELCVSMWSKVELLSNNLTACALLSTATISNFKAFLLKKLNACHFQLCQLLWLLTKYVSESWKAKQTSKVDEKIATWKQKRNFSQDSIVCENWNLLRGLKGAFILFTLVFLLQKGENSFRNCKNWKCAYDDS